MQYVLGFAFDDLGRVALIRKTRPDWQRGLLNGIGGKINPGEACRDAMMREFYEETGVVLPADRWTRRGEMGNEVSAPEKSWRVHVYTVTSPLVRLVRTTTDETVDLYTVHDVRQRMLRCIANVPALIELCLIPPEAPSNVSPSFVLRY